jgi:hypothetical protein
MTENIRVGGEGSGHGTRDNLFILFQVRNGSEGKTPVSDLYEGQSQSSQTKEAGTNRSPEMSAYEAI